MNLRSAALAALAATFLSFPIQASEPAPTVVVSIKPLHSLVSAVMMGAGEPYLLLPDGASPHAHALKLSDATALENADAVFWIGEGLEAFLHDAIGTLAKNAVSTEVAALPDIELLAVREGGIWTPHRHDHVDGHEDEHAVEHEHDDGHEHADEHEHERADEHDHVTHDMHVWLDPDIARRIVAAAADVLARIDAGRAALYRANAEETDTRLAALDGDLAAMLKPVQAQPFVVFHDAYAYLERRYELTARGSIVIDPEQAPGARRIAELRDLIAARGAVCIFSEPQFTPKMVERLAADTGIRAATLDPLGVGIAPGPDAYAKLMLRNAEAIRDCLEASS